MALILDPDQIADGTEYTIDTALREFTLNSGSGNLSNDGVILQAIYSSFKDDWKDDPQTKTLIAYPFPMVAITPEQFEFVFNWEPNSNTTRKLIRTGGWREIDTDNNTKLKSEYSGVITLGAFEDNINDTAYYQAGTDPTDTSSTIDFAFSGPVNEAILVYEENVPADTTAGFDFTANTITRNDAGDWVTDGYRVGAQITILNATLAANNGTFIITNVTSGVITVSGTPFTSDTADQTVSFAKNYRNAITLFLRIRDADTNGKTYSQATLADIGVSEVGNQVFRFPLSNQTDLKIEESDVNIAAQSPYTEINLKYFSNAFSRTVDTPGVTRDFGIVIDVGTHSGIDGSITAAGSTLTTSEGGIETDGRYIGGTLTVHEGTDAETIFTVASVTATAITINETFTATETDISFTLQRSSPVIASAEEIFEKIQYLLRQPADINDITGVVSGQTADELLSFVGDNLNAGSQGPNNPLGGGSGVAIEGFDSNDTNRITLTDNTSTERSFPFVSAGNINFNDNLIADSGPAKYTMFFRYTQRTTVSDLAISAASGATASIDSTLGELPTVSQNDYINIIGFANPSNNGIWQVTDASPTANQFDATKVNGDTVVDEGPISGAIELNPINSPDAIIVQDNSGSNIAGTISGESISFDFDYDGNIQGGRTSSTNASVIIRAIGTNTAQFVETTGTISRTTGLVFSLVAALERNYLAGTS